MTDSVIPLLPRLNAELYESHASVELLNLRIQKANFENEKAYLRSLTPSSLLWNDAGGESGISSTIAQIELQEKQVDDMVKFYKQEDELQKRVDASSGFAVDPKDQQVNELQSKMDEITGIRLQYPQTWALTNKNRIEIDTVTNRPATEQTPKENRQSVQISDFLNNLSYEQINYERQRNEIVQAQRLAYEASRIGQDPLSLDLKQLESSARGRLSQKELDVPDLGLALTVISDIGPDNKVIFGVQDETGKVFKYNGPQHPNSTTTIYGRWTGPAPYANDVPVRVKGTGDEPWQTSALDSFSLLYTILTYEEGHHNQEYDDMYVNRIIAALDRKIISIDRDYYEFRAATRILDAFAASGHIFAVASPDPIRYAISAAASAPAEVRPILYDAGESFPAFTFSEGELEQYRDFLNRYGKNLEVPQSIEQLLAYMQASNLDQTYEYGWFRRQFASQSQAQFAFQYIVDQLRQLHTSSSGMFLPQWQRVDTSFSAHKASVNANTIVNEITEILLSKLA